MEIAIAYVLNKTERGSYICVICLMYDPPEAAEEDFYGPVDHAIIRFKKCFGLHTCCYKVALSIIGK